MKYKKIVDAYKCDFCKEERHDKCVVCGKDICLVHSAMICLHYDPQHYERICWDHFTDDVKEFIKHPHYPTTR